MVGLGKTGSSYRHVSALTGHPTKIAMRLWNESIEEGRSQRRAGIVVCNMTTAPDDHHLFRMAVMDHTISSKLSRS